jgi:AraC-like DNA-binding protein
MRSRLFIKNMVCLRCIHTVHRLLKDAGLEVRNVVLGEVEFDGAVAPAVLGKLKEFLEKEGFELLDDKQSRLVEKIKTVVIRSIHHEDDFKPVTMNYSDFLARQTGYDYSSLSKLFSSVEGITIEKYIISQKIERVKEMLVYDELSLSEIAWRMGYSSSQHLSNQFRQVTGMTPTEFKNTHPHDRQHLDHV